MCTLAVALGADRRWPVVVAANRDERLGRPSEGWALRDGAGGPRYAAPRDAEAGGTWIGVAQTGLLVGITNYYSPDDRFPDALASLTPEFLPSLPHDVTSGNPLTYRLTDDGQFELHGNGWNHPVAGDRRWWIRPIAGEWIWRYPAR